MPLRKCQEDAIACITNRRASGDNETNLSLCTGAGKSLIISKITQTTERRILVFPWLDLLRQYYNNHKSTYAKDTCIRYLATEGTLADIELLTDMDDLDNESYVLFTTYTSAPLIFKELCEDRKVDLLCHDEAHRTERPDYKEALAGVADYIGHAVNLSATLPLAKLPHYKYSLLRGINDGVVRDFHMRLLMCTAKERNETTLIINIVKSLLAMHKQVKLLVYTSEANTDVEGSSSVKTFMEAHSDKIKKQGWWIEGIKADTRDRFSLLRQFEQRRDVSILVSCKTLSEGIDLKNANCMLPWDPSNSTVENIQRIGRVLRLYKTGGKVVTEQPPSTILIPVFLNEDKYAECDGNSDAINELLLKEISQAEKGDFKPIVNVCTALKDELADDDPDLFNRLLNYEIFPTVEINRSLVDCIAKHKGIESNELLDELIESLDDEDNTDDILEGNLDGPTLEKIANNGDMTIIVKDNDEIDVFGNGEDVIVVKKNKDTYTLAKKTKTINDAIVNKRISKRLQYDFTDNCKIVLGLETMDKTNYIGNMILMRLTSNVKLDENWEKRRLEWVAIYEILGHCPSGKSIDLAEKRAGEWQSQQRIFYKNKVLSMTKQRIIILNNTTGWKWQEDNPWYLQLNHWIEIRKKLGKNPSQKSDDPIEKRAGRWQSQQRMHYKNNSPFLTTDRIALLNKIPEWKWDDTDIWQLQLDKWIALYRALGRNPSKRSTNLAEKRAGEWQSDQRKNYKNKALCMTPERIKLLELVPGWAWEIEDSWQLQLNQWIIIREKLGKNPSQKSKNLDEKRVGHWQSIQRARYRHNSPLLTPKQITILNETKYWEWEEHDAWTWHLNNWIKIYKKLNRYPSSTSKNLEEKRAGQWQSDQRKNYKNKASCMTPKRIAILESTPGWTWFVKEKAKLTVTSTEPEITITKRKRASIVPSTEPAITIIKRKISTLEAYHKRFKTMNASTYGDSITPAEFENYHKVADLHDKRDTPENQPLTKIAKLLAKYNKPSYTAIDLGCGQNRLRTNPFVSGMNWTSVDVHAVDDTVTVANMGDLPYDDESYDFAVLGRSLWARNHMDVLAEIFRVLKSGGRLVICESFRRWLTFDNDVASNSLLQCLTDAGFEIIYKEGTEVDDTETTDVFQYIIARKP